MTTLMEPPPNAEARVITPLRLNTSRDPLSLVSADLMPDEVRARRRLAYVKRRLVFGLVALALVIGLGDTLARQQTGAAESDLASARQRVNALNQQTTRFGAVVGVQTETQQITTLLTQAMAGDVPWATLTSTLQRLAPRGLTLTGVDGETGAGTAAAAPAAPPTAGSSPTPSIVGTLTLTGSADGYRAVADYVAALVSVPGLTAVNPATTAAGAGKTLTFTVTASLTTAAQGGRYAPSAQANSAPAGSPTNAVSPAAGPAATDPTTADPTTAAAGPSAAQAPVGN